MTQKDKALIEESEELVRLGDHNEVDRLMRKAESEDAREELEEASRLAFLRERLAFECEGDY